MGKHALINFFLVPEIIPSAHLSSIQGKTIDNEQMPPRNLVFLVDTSGSMNTPNRLPLLKPSLALLTRQLNARDRVSIVG